MLKKGPIKNIFMLDNVVIDKKLDKELDKSMLETVIMIDISNDKGYIYNLTTGKDLSFNKNIKINIIQGLTKSIGFYANYNEDKNEISDCEINNISLYKNSILYNNYSKVNINKSDYLVFEYKDKSKLIVDYINNTIYTRNNYDIKYKNKKSIFENGIKNTINGKYFIRRIKYIKLFKILLFH